MRTNKNACYLLYTFYLEKYLFNRLYEIIIFYFLKSFNWFYSDKFSYKEKLRNGYVIIKNQRIDHFKH